MIATRMRVATVNRAHLRLVPALPRRRLRWRPVMALRGVVIGALLGGCVWAVIIAGVRAAFGQPDTAAGLIAAGLGAAGLAVCAATGKRVRR